MFKASDTVIWVDKDFELSILNLCPYPLYIDGLGTIPKQPDNVLKFITMTDESNTEFRKVGELLDLPVQTPTLQPLLINYIRIYANQAKHVFVTERLYQLLLNGMLFKDLHIPSNIYVPVGVFEYDITQPRYNDVFSQLLLNRQDANKHNVFHVTEFQV